MITIFLSAASVKADTGCKSFTPVTSYPIYTTGIGGYDGKPLYDFNGGRVTITDFNCLKDTGRGCFIRITEESQCTDGCVRTKDANGYYYKPGTEYEFDASNPGATCDLEGTVLFFAITGLGAGFIRKKIMNSWIDTVG